VQVGDADPPFKPEHVHVHGPLPETEEAEPDEQRLEDGLVYVLTAAEPQRPSTFFKTVQVDEDKPPFKPKQVQDHGPEPPKPLTEPALQEPLDNEYWDAVLPQTPLTFNGAVHVGDAPPFEPEHVQVHGPLPETEEAEPVEQRLEEGLV
jgi:hypothetical protein